MNISEFLLAAMAASVSATALAILYGEYKPTLSDLRSRANHLRQTGDSSLSPKSVNWLAASAFGAAVLICVVFM